MQLRSPSSFSYHPQEITILQSPSTSNKLSMRLTLCKGFLHISSHPGQRVLRCVGWGGAGRGRPDGHWNRSTDSVAGWGTRGACPLGLQNNMRG